MILWLTCPWGLLVMLFRFPYIASFPHEIGSGWGFSFTPLRHSSRFGTLFLQVQLVPSGDGTRGLPLPNRGCPWDSSGPGLSLLTSLLSSSAYGYYCRGGGVVTLRSVRVYTPRGLTMFALPVPPPPCGVGGTPGRTHWALVLPVGSLSYIGY